MLFGCSAAFLAAEIGAVYHFGVVTIPPKKSSDRDGTPKKGEPKRDLPTGDERPVDDKTPVTRHG
jgi:hypothetical protein